MKMKNLVKLICLLVIIAALSLWAFGANVSIFGKKFVAWDEAMLTGNDIDKSMVFVYNVAKPEKVENFDVHKETLNAVDVISKRAEFWDYKGVTVRVEGNDNVVVTMPLSVYRSGIETVFGYNGNITVKDSSKNTVFTSADIEGASLVGYEQTNSGLIYYIDVFFNDEAEAKLEEITSNGAYSLTFALDESLTTSTLTGSDAIKNGTASLKFTSGAEEFELCANSGAIEGAITLQGNSVVTGTAGEDAGCVIATAALVILLATLLYFLLSSKLLGLAATLSAFIGFLVYDFFAATFNWLLVDAGAIAGMLVGVLMMIFAHIFVLNEVTKQYIKGKDVVSALDNGSYEARKFILELAFVAVVIGVGFWIVGAGFASFGITLMGGAVVAAITSVFVFKFVAKIFVGLGASNKAMGLKRGE